ncbi:MAG: hypothetical protein Kow0090_18810 [Myxococcota bacterium]
MKTLIANKNSLLIAILALLPFLTSCASAPETKPTDEKTDDTKEKKTATENEVGDGEAVEEELVEEESVDSPKRPIEPKASNIKKPPFPASFKFPGDLAILPELENRYNSLPEKSQLSKEGVFVKEYIEMAYNLTLAAKFDKAKKAMLQAKDILDDMKVIEDSDEDGVADDEDICPNQPKGNTDPYKKYGCPDEGDVGFAAITVFDSEGKEITDLKVAGFTKKLLKGEGKASVNCVGAPGSYELTITSGDKSVKVGVKIEKASKSFYNATVK